MRLVWICIIFILIAVALSGCSKDMTSLMPNSEGPVCSALIGPIKYNSTKPGSKRFAGSALAPDLKARNQVGQNLACPAYK